MNFNQYGYSRERRKFGRQCVFADRNELLFSIHQRMDLRKSYILRNPVDRGTQFSVAKGLSTALTENVTYAPHGIVHTEGGWPKDVNILDEEQTQRHRKKIEREDSWGIQVVDLAKTATKNILQNSAVNIYEDYLSEIEPMEIRSPFTARPNYVFNDPFAPFSRPIIQTDWCPGNLEHLMSVHTNLNFFPATNEPNDFFIWDIVNPLKVLSTFSGPTWTRKACYCPRDEFLIAGGFINGKVGLWDTRIDSHQCASICPLEAAHRESVSALCWVHSKSNTEFYTGSLDGSIHYWDGRNLKNWYMQILLDDERTDQQKRTRARGATVLEFEYTIPIRYIIGDDMGNVYVGNRKGTTPTETLILIYKLFSGPIRTIERNPFFVKNFLIVGGWCAKIWSEETKDFPITMIFKRENQVMCGSWSTTRCSVFATGDVAGNVDFWDLLLYQKEPIFSLNFKHCITTIKFRKDGELVAISTVVGNIYLLELDQSLKQSGQKEKSLLGMLFEREGLRSKLLQDRLEEIKLHRATMPAENKEDLREEDDAGFHEEAVEEIESEEEEGEEEGEKDPDPEFTEIRTMFMEVINAIKEKWKEREFVNEPSPFEGPGNYYELKSHSNSMLADDKSVKSREQKPTE